MNGPRVNNPTNISNPKLRDDHNNTQWMRRHPSSNVYHNSPPTSASSSDHHNRSSQYQQQHPSSSSSNTSSSAFPFTSASDASTTSSSPSSWVNGHDALSFLSRSSSSDPPPNQSMDLFPSHPSSASDPFWSPKTDSHPSDHSLFCSSQLEQDFCSLKLDSRDEFTSRRLDFNRSRNQNNKKQTSWASVASSSKHKSSLKSKMGVTHRPIPTGPEPMIASDTNGSCPAIPPSSIAPSSTPQTPLPQPNSASPISQPSHQYPPHAIPRQQETFNNSHRNFQRVDSGDGRGGPAPFQDPPHILKKDCNHLENHRSAPVIEPSGVRRRILSHPPSVPLHPRHPPPPPGVHLPERRFEKNLLPHDIRPEHNKPPQQHLPPPTLLQSSSSAPRSAPHAVPLKPVIDPSTVLNRQHLEHIFNPKEFDLNPVDTRFFVIKSYSEDDIHRSIKYSIWCSTEHGNKRLDDAFKSQKDRGPIYLFYSVNGSGHFCGMAQMMSTVDYNCSANVWAQDKWKGQFKVRWIYVKDVPNNQLRHIRLENNENKPVTNSRDTQEVPPEKGKQVLAIIHSFQHSTSIFDDFLHYEKRQEEESNRKTTDDPSLLDSRSRPQPTDMEGQRPNFPRRDFRPPPPLHLQRQGLPSHHPNSFHPHQSGAYERRDRDFFRKPLPSDNSSWRD